VEAITDRETLRSELSRLAHREQSAVGGLVAILFRNPERARDREWVAEQFAHVAQLAGEFDSLPELEAYAGCHGPAVLRATLGLFGVVAQDMQPRLARGFTSEDAMAQAMTYFVPAEQLSDEV
jgi:hypothetical protein